MTCLCNNLHTCPANILGATELQGPVIYDYKDLKSAANGFGEENKLGEGGFGEVYKVIFAYINNVQDFWYSKLLLTGHIKKWKCSCCEEDSFK